MQRRAGPASALFGCVPRTGAVRLLPRSDEEPRLPGAIVAVEGVAVEHFVAVFDGPLDDDGLAGKVGERHLFDRSAAPATYGKARLSYELTAVRPRLLPSAASSESSWWTPPVPMCARFRMLPAV